MNKESIIDALMALANNLENRSKISQLREIHPHIEVLKRSGLTNAKIVETLNSQGFNLSLKSFETMLYRIREEAKAVATNAWTSSPSNFQPEKGTHQSQPTTSIPPSTWSTDQGRPTGPPGLPSKPDTTGLSVELGHEAESYAVGSSNPKDVDKIIGSNPNLVELAKSVKRKKK